jgi:hypothetical protein
MLGEASSPFRYSWEFAENTNRQDDGRVHLRSAARDAI